MKFKYASRGLVLLCAVMVCSAAFAQVYLYDFGSAESAVQEGFVAITPDTAYDGETAGFTAAEGMIIRDRAHEEYQETSRGMTPPPVWTGPLSQDSAVSPNEAEFRARVQPGEYEVWVLCGTSEAYRAQYFDFDITVGNETQRVRFEAGYQYREAVLPLNAADGEAVIRFTPRSLFAVSGLAIYPAARRAQVDEDILDPVRQIVHIMPPEQMERWVFEPNVDDNPWPEISAADRNRGYIVHGRHWADLVFPNTVPLPWGINPTLRAFATLGEYEPLTFTLYPLRDFAGVDITVSDLVTANGTIPASAVEVRRVKYMLCRPNYTILHVYRRNPDPLMPFDPDEPLVAEENARFWLTVHVPEDAAPGQYRGSVTVTPRDGAAAEIPVVLRVLPIRLQEDPDKIYSIYYRDPLDDWNRAQDDVSREYFLQKSEWEMQDLVAHGTRNVTSGLWVAPERPDEEGVFDINTDLMQMKIDRWRRYDFKFPLVISINAGGIYRKHTGKELGSHIRDAEKPPPEYVAELTRMVQAIETERVNRDWPEFLYYPVDEPTTLPGAIEFMIDTLKAVQSVGVRTYVTAAPHNPGFEPLRPYIDVWCTQPFLPSREEILADRAQRDVDYWCYPNHVNGENDHTTVNGARMTYGFGFWRSGFTTLIPWIYRSDNGNPWNYLDGTNSDFFNRKEDSGRPIPVAMWEAYREGYDDYRYVYTCQKLIEKGLAQGGAAAQAAQQAQADLDYIWEQIRVLDKYKDVGLWAPREIDVYRWLVAENILRLQEAGVRLTDG